MDLKGTMSLVVDEESAAPVSEGVERMGIERDHSHMCKFEDENAPGYDVVAEAIQRYAEEAPKTIAKRWIEEKSIRNVERREAAEELLGGTSSILYPHYILF
jgi:protein SERAC1